MKSIASTLMILALGSAGASEQHAMTAGDLQELCTGSDHVSVNACRVYILGVTEGIAVGLRMAGGKSGGGRPCIPDNVSAQELEQTVKSRLDEDLTAHPANRTLDASRFIGAVLAHAFPCGTGPAPR
jgi:Rap1a immunity proteins